MSLRDKFRKLGPNKKSPIPQTNQGNGGTGPGPSQPSSTPRPDTSPRWKHLKLFVRALEQATRPLPPLKAAVSELAGSLGAHDSLLRGRKEYETLHSELEELFQTLQKHCTENIPPAITMTVEALCKAIQDEIADIKDKKGKRKLRDYLEAEQGIDTILACYRRVQGCLQRLSLNVDLSVWRIVDELAVDNRLNRLASSLSACYNSAQATELKRGPCTKGTRVDLLSQMLDWVNSSSPDSVYWMSGMAGTGKTTIAYSLCEELDADRQLGASFFCSRLLPECRNINLIVPSVAYQLARYSLPFRYALASVLEKDPDVHTRLLHLQFGSLLAQPLLEVKDTLPNNLVVVIDALDECDNKESTSQILDILLTEGSNLPVKFMVSSRPEPEIRDEMTKQGDPAHSRVVLHELDRCAVQADIETYLRATLTQMSPTEEQISKLIEQAGVLFIYAATVVRYVGYDKFRRNPQARLANVLESSSKSENKHKELDELYSTILRAALDDPKLDSKEQEDLQLVLHTVICAQEPLTVQILSKLLQINDTERVRAALCPLWSVLHISGMSELVTVLHVSFHDYMLDSSRSRQYHCDRRVHNQIIAGLCFDLFRDLRPQFNICELESSYVPDDKVEGLDERVKDTISMELFYAARYWAIHIQYAPGSPDLIWELEEFLSRQLLLWMEVMNLKRCTGSMPVLLRLVEKWEAVSRAQSPSLGRGTDTGYQERPTELDALIHDAWRFTSTFALTAVTDSTPHIYTSMLPLWPELSPVAKCYKRRTQGLISAEGTTISRREHALLASWSFDEHLGSPVFSPDGTRIAVGVKHRVYILNSSTGQEVLPPFEAHQEYVSSVQFSPEGLRIVSSDDNTIYVWSVQTGKTILGPLKGSIGSRVYQAAFTPDGTSVISLSRSIPSFSSGSLLSEILHSIAVWDALGEERIIKLPCSADTYISTASITGSFNKQCVVFGSTEKIFIYNAQGVWVLKKLLGTEDNRDFFYRIEISPDGTRIAAVKGKYIYVWDLETGIVALGPLSSSTSCFSISFSPSNFYLIASSPDGIRMWDVRNGNLVIGPLAGNDTILSLGFSPDGIYIICSTYDRKLYLWDTRSNTHTILNSQHGHAKCVLEVGFSPDGTRLISGSEDGTARVWDTESGEMLLGPLERTTVRWSQLTAFSPDGGRIILQQKHGLVLLDAQTGNVTLDPLHSHDDAGRSWAVFSPDSTCIAITTPRSQRREYHVQILATDTGRVLRSIHLYKGTLTSLAFSSDGAQLLIRTRDHSVSKDRDRLYIYAAHSGKLLTEICGNFPWSKLSPDGAQINFISKSRAIAQDMKTGKQLLGPLLEGFTRTGRNPIGEFSPDCTHIAFATQDRAIYVWDAQTGQRVLGPFKWHTSRINSVKFSPDGTRVVSGSDDQTIRVTDVQAIPNLVPGSSPNDFGEWFLQEDGWIVDELSNLLVWVPPDLRSSSVMGKVLPANLTLTHFNPNLYAPNMNKTAKDLTAGTVGGIAQVLVGQPFDIVKVRMQTAPAGAYKGMIDCATGILKNEGPLAFYKGTLTPLLGIGLCVSIQFAALEGTKRAFADMNKKKGIGGPDGATLSGGQLLVAGAVAGLANSIVSGPVEHIRIRLQTQPHHAKLYDGPLDAVRKIYRSNGLAGIFKGQNPTLLREATGYASYFWAYEKLMQREMRVNNCRREDIAPTKAVLFGAAAGYALWGVIFPIDMIKSRIQTDGFSFATGQKYKSGTDAARQIWKAEGMAAFTRGLIPILIRSPFANGATFLGFEMASRFLNKY